MAPENPETIIGGPGPGGNYYPSFPSGYPKLRGSWKNKVGLSEGRTFLEKRVPIPNFVGRHPGTGGKLVVWAPGLFFNPFGGGGQGIGPRF